MRTVPHCLALLTLILGLPLPGWGQPLPFGSGSFGRWMEDPSGLPAYLYTCEQERDPKARTPVNPSFRLPTEHTHQIGNDRLVAQASNYGVVQVRQDEGGAKLLNEVHPPKHQYGGGFGYLSDGRTTLSTLYQGNASSFQRILGVGYLRKWTVGGPYVVDQVILAPFGDDPLLVSQVTVQNRGRTAAELRWIEYWGGQHYPLTFAPDQAAVLAGDADGVHQKRRQKAARFHQSFRRIGDTGLIDTKVPRSQAPRPEAADGPEPRQDPDPPPVFLVSLDEPVSGFSTDASRFFGQGGARAPDGLRPQSDGLRPQSDGLRPQSDGLNRPLDGSLTPPAGEAAFLLERRFRLLAGERRTLYFAFGYQAPGVDVSTLIAKYRNTPEMHWAQSNTAWRYVGLRLSVFGEPWVERELLWHNYYLRSNLTYDSFFGEHVLSTGHVHQWIQGFPGAARDRLQHALPLVFSQPATVKEILRSTLKGLKADGEMPYGFVDHGRVLPTARRPSDLQLWLLWLASEYVLGNRDLAFLDQVLPTYPAGAAGEAASRQLTVGRLLQRSFRYLVDRLGVGEHGLLRLKNADWNDDVLAHLPPEEQSAVASTAESLLNAAMASYVFDLYAELLTYAGDTALAGEVRGHAAAQRQAVQRQWTGRWFRRAWLNRELGWLGEDRLWLEPQPWAILGGAATPEQTATLVEAIDESLRHAPLGARLLSRPRDKVYGQAQEIPGVLTNGGVFAAINGTLVWALARVDGTKAWEEWRRNTLAHHAEAYPEIWYGIWSGPDVYNSTLSSRPGETLFLPPRRNDDGQSVLTAFNRTDFPVMSMHSHAWPLYSAAKLLGIEFDALGLTLRPSLPAGRYDFSSPLVGLSRTDGGFRGWYKPSQRGEWRVRFIPPQEAAESVHRVVLNGMQIPPYQADGGGIEFQAEGSPNAPLRFEILLQP